MEKSEIFIKKSVDIPEKIVLDGIVAIRPQMKNEREKGTWKRKSKEYSIGNTSG